MEQEAAPRENNTIKILLGLNSFLLTALLGFVMHMVSQNDDLKANQQLLKTEIEVLKSTVAGLEKKSDKLQDQLDDYFRDEIKRSAR